MADNETALNAQKINLTFEVTAPEWVNSYRLFSYCLRL